MASAPGQIDSPETLRTLRELAEKAARAGGEVARRRFGGRFRLSRKPDGSEVTDVDEEAQAAVLACLRAARPQDAIVAEETLPSGTPAGAGHLPEPSSAPLCWVVDPLDGTRNYVNRIPVYAVSVAAVAGGTPMVGAIYWPERDDMYSVERSAGPLLNGQLLAPVALPVSPVPDRLQKPLVGIPSAIDGAAYELVQDWVGRVIVRNFGSTALHLVMVAAGQLQAALISDSRLWDIAAGWLLVRAMGGVMSRLDGGAVFPLDVARYRGEPIPSLASRNPDVHAQMLRRRGAAR